MSLDVSLGAAFLAGIVSFLAPCVLPLVPGYLAWLAGISLDEAGRARLRVLASAALFVLGFSTVFVVLGATASFAGRLLNEHMAALSVVAGVVIVLFGLHQLGLFRFSLLDREARMAVPVRPPGLAGAYLVGLAFGFGWTPCAGPVLSVILMLAGAEASMLRGSMLLAAYSAGLGLPFLAAAFFAGAFRRFIQRFRQHMPLLDKAMGLVLVLTGLLFITGTINRIGFCLYEKLPWLGSIG